MIGFLGASYLWVKAAHVTFIIFWIAGLFIVPRYYVHHHETTPGSAEDRAWTERADRARTVILLPALVLSWLLGLALALHIGAFTQGWFHAKLLLVILLSAYHGWVVSFGKKLAAGERPMQGRSLRMINEVPALFTILIVVMVIVRPF
ncbi:CopD family protein [Sphingomicrobium clamense]|uniref:Protoporphyrinogen IX oxidase n=1 Tax=Sphingomicrobium clamense TaxID=2851013 RepID=A0ABS6V300_9SPHN|nr:CopD family protein [Sphingomicrobium sp. B8]MBW0143937.1 CopD family protein [Sphingomicrobium sp. B8]